MEIMPKLPPPDRNCCPGRIPILPVCTGSEISHGQDSCFCIVDYRRSRFL